MRVSNVDTIQDLGRTYLWLTNQVWVTSLGWLNKENQSEQVEQNVSLWQMWLSNIKGGMVWITGLALGFLSVVRSQNQETLMIVSITTTLALRPVTFEPHGGSEGKANLCLRVFFLLNPWSVEVHKGLFAHSISLKVNRSQLLFFVAPFWSLDSCEWPVSGDISPR